MNKVKRLLAIFSLLFLIFESADAQAPRVAFCKGVDVMGNVAMELDGYRFVAKPYGVRSINKLLTSKSVTTTCREALKRYYLAHPEDKFFVHSLFKKEQLYPIYLKQKESIVSVRGLTSLSELLLEQGLGVLELGWSDKEFMHLFQAAQARAKAAKKGIWGGVELSICANEIHKE